MPLPAFGHVFSGFEFLGIILVTAIPFGIYDLVEAMDNVESAEAAGDAYPTTQVLTADGVVSLIGCLMGNPFINAVYIGHPGWKAMGGRIGYSAATGVMVIVLSLVRHHRGDVVADPGGRDLADPALHRHADRRAGVPGDAEEPCARDRAGADPAPRGLGQAADRQLARRRPAPTPQRSGSTSSARSACSITGSRCWAAAPSSAGWCSAPSRAFIIDKKFAEAAAFAAAGAVLTFFGFMHGESVGFAVTPSVAIAYAMVAVFLFALSSGARHGGGFSSRARCDPCGVTVASLLPRGRGRLSGFCRSSAMPSIRAPSTTVTQ